MKTKKLELYIHIPFCKRKCNYCDFLSFPSDEKSVIAYMSQLKDEINSWKDLAKEYVVTSIFIGGGTPSIIDGVLLREMLAVVKNTFCCDTKIECSIEINPGTIDETKLLEYQKAGINRISFGLQSTVNEELQILGRIHTYDEFLKSYHMARKIGFDNINIDLMSAIPTQSIESYEKTLTRVCELEPEHISAYSLIIEEGTDFYNNELILSKLPTEDEDVQMYELTEKILKEHGFHRYELSNYAKEGFECKHNCGYWKRTPYLGFGLGASSLFEEGRFSGETDFVSYLHQNDWQMGYKKKDCLTRKEQMEEFMFLGLRMMEGISMETFQHKFGVSVGSVYDEELKELRKEGLIEIKSGRIYLTSKGYFLSNQVFVKFL